MSKGLHRTQWSATTATLAYGGHGDRPRAVLHGHPLGSNEA